MAQHHGGSLHVRKHAPRPPHSTRRRGIAACRGVPRRRPAAEHIVARWNDVKEMLTYSRHRSFRVAWASLTLIVVLLTTTVASAQTKPPPTPKPSVESAMVEVATHLSPPYAL